METNVLKYRFFSSIKKGNSFKFSNNLDVVLKSLVAYSLIIKIMFLCLSFCLVVNHANALSVRTANVIQGTEPYFSLDGGVTKELTMEGLLWLKIADDRVINVKEDHSTLTQPIIVPQSVKFNHFQTIVPSSSAGNSIYPRVLLNDIIRSSSTTLVDEDGDSNLYATGEIRLQWFDRNDNDITKEIGENSIQELDPCKAPYSLIMTTAKENSLKTRYGLPNITNLSSAKHTYYISPQIIKPYVCYATTIDYKIKGSMYIGKGFINGVGYEVGDINNPSSNFPTVAVDGYFFYLVLAGVTPEQVVAANGTTVMAESGNGVSLSLSAEKEIPGSYDFPTKRNLTVLKILFNGPNVNSVNKHFSPSLFKIYADNSHNQLLYSFKIERWFIQKPQTETVNYSEAIEYCNSFGSGYRLPAPYDYSNETNKRLGWNGGLPQDAAWFHRQLSYRSGDRWVGGLYNEWGNQDRRPSPVTQPFGYWTSFIINNAANSTVNGRPIIISWTGAVRDSYLYYQQNIGCVTP